MWHHMEFSPNRLQEHVPSESGPANGQLHQPLLPGTAMTLQNPGIDPHSTASRPSSSEEFSRAKSSGSSAHLAKTMRGVNLFLLPLVAAAYLGFSWVVYTKPVLVNSRGLFSDSTDNLAQIKAGVTTISILVVSISLWPCRALLQDIKSEEFFRMLLKHRFLGVPLKSVNAVSTPSYSSLDGLFLVLSRHCSSYFAAGLFAGILIIAANSLAPAILSADVILLGGNLEAFSVGSLARDSVLNTSWTGDMRTYPLLSRTDRAASVAFAENHLGLTAFFTLPKPDPNTGERYIVPIPGEVRGGQAAQWITNVIAFSPSCTFPPTNVSTEIIRPEESMVNVTNNLYQIVFPTLGIAVPPSFFDRPSTFHSAIDHYNPFLITNSTLDDPDVSGSSVWQLTQCLEGCEPLDLDSQITLNFTGLPTITIQAQARGGQVVTIQSTFLVCTPNVRTETLEVRLDLDGQLRVITPESSATTSNQGSTLTDQKNIDIHQARFLMAYSIEQSESPQFLVRHLGSTVQAEMILDREVLSSLKDLGQLGNTNGTILRPLPESQITEAYGNLVQSSTKSFLDGGFGRATVPGRVYRQAVALTTSLPHLVASTALFAILSILMLISHLRSGKGQHFTLYTAAKALNHSEGFMDTLVAASGSPLRNDATRIVAKNEQEAVLRQMGNKKVWLGDTRYQDAAIQFRE